MKRLILVDFDGTLTHSDTTKALICSLLPSRPHLFMLLVYYIVRILFSNENSIQRWKNRAIGRLIEGKTENELLRFFEKYKKKVIPNLRTNLIGYLKQKCDEGFIVLVVTASPRIAVNYCILELPFTVLGTEFEMHNGALCKNVIDPICYGDGKVTNILGWVSSSSEEPFVFSESWSDSLSDLPMMNMSERKFWVCRKTERAKLASYCSDAEFFG
jgi:phosphoserine phosphatase